MNAQCGVCTLHTHTHASAFGLFLYCYSACWCFQHNLNRSSQTTKQNIKIVYRMMMERSVWIWTDVWHWHTLLVARQPLLRPIFFFVVGWLFMFRVYVVYRNIDAYQSIGTYLCIPLTNTDIQPHTHRFLNRIVFETTSCSVFNVHVSRVAICQVPTTNHCVWRVRAHTPHTHIAAKQ